MHRQTHLHLPDIPRSSHIITMNTPSKHTSNQLNAYAIFLILERQRNIKLRELYHNKQQVVDTLLPMISEESSSSSSSVSAASSNDTPTSKSSLRQAMKQTKKIKKCDASSSIGSSSSSSMSTLPKFPPRYQALSNIITSDGLMMHLRTTTTTTTTTMSTSPRSCSIRPRSSSSRYMDEYKNLDQGTKRFLTDTVKLLQDRCNEEIENNETKLETPMGRSSTKRSRRMVVGSKKMFVFRVEKKLSLIVD